MANYYIYFISSLPMLSFSANPPFPTDKFLEMCQGMIPEQELAILKESLHIGPDYDYRGAAQTLRKWSSFNIALRNEIVKIRAARRHVGAEKYLRSDGYGSLDVAHIAIASHRSPSLIEGEKILDQARWGYLEELSSGHYFDFDYLLVYLQKLIILERWMRINTSNRQALLKGMLSRG
jgi:hypothetical protein